MTDEIRGALSFIGKYLNNANNNKFLIVNVNNADDYLSIKSYLEAELSVIKLSNFCRPDDMPDFEKYINFSCKVAKNSLLLGVSEYLKLKDETSFDIGTQIIISAVNISAKVVVLYFDCEKKLKALLNRDIRLKNQNQIILIKGSKPENSKIRLLNGNMKINGNVNVIKGIKTYLDKCEEECLVNSVVSTKYYDCDYSKSNMSVQKISDAFDLLGILTTVPSKITSSLGTDSNWKYLCENINESIFENILIKEFGNLDNIETLFYEWKEWSDNKRWLYFIALKLTKLKNKYLDFVIKKSTSNADFIFKIYSSILDISHTNKEFDLFYRERKWLIGLVNDDSCINEFCALVKVKAKERIHYLTDCTPLERENIFEWLNELNFIDDTVKEILSKVYPDLISYLTEYNVGVDSYNDYFKQYKLQKLNNKIYDGFINVVNENAKKRDYNLFLKTRNEVFEKIDKTESIIYFIDALGVEFLGYISKISSELGLSIHVSVTKANLPTTTFSNKGFLDEFRNNYYDIKLLDNVKHNGEGDYNYEFTKLPLHIPEELKIIKDVFVKIKATLSKSAVKKVIVVSDHGASRLVVLHDKKFTFPTETNGTQGGRCCKYVDGMNTVDYATIESGQYVLASYDRFKTHGSPRVETHGGATLEELMVPIIVVTNENERITATPLEDVITVSYKNKAVLRIFVTKHFDKITVRIKNKFYESTEFDGNYFTVPIHDIVNIGEYKGEVFASEQYIDEISFKLVKPTSNEKDFGI